MTPDPNNAAPARAVYTRYPWLAPGVKGVGRASLLADIGHGISTAPLPSLRRGSIGFDLGVLGARPSVRGRVLWIG